MPRSRWFALRVSSVPSSSAPCSTGMALLLLLPARATSAARDFGPRLQEVAARARGRERARATSATTASPTSCTARCWASRCVDRALRRAVRAAARGAVAALSGRRRARLRELLAKQGARDSLGYFALRRDKSVVWSAERQGGDHLPRRARRRARQRRPDRRPRGVARRHRRLPRARRRVRLDAGGHGLQRDRRDGVQARVRPVGADARRRGDRRGRRLHPGGTADARRAPGLHPGRARRLRGRGAPGRPTSRRPRSTSCRDRGRAWRGDAVERGFSMALSRLGDPADASCVVATARSDGALRGLLHFVPVGHGRAVARPHAPRPRRRQRAERVHDRDGAAAGRHRSGCGGCR